MSLGTGQNSLPFCLPCCDFLSIPDNRSIVSREIGSYESRTLPNDNAKNYANILQRGNPNGKPKPKGAQQIFVNFENLKFSYNDLKKITNGFKDNIGTGGFGGVYLGHLEEGLQVAVKVPTQSSNRELRSFWLRPRI